MSCSSSLPWFDHLNQEFIKFLTKKCCPFPFLDPCTLFSSYTLNICSSHRIRYQVSHQYKITGKTVPHFKAISFSHNLTNYNSQWLSDLNWIQNKHWQRFYTVYWQLSFLPSHHNSTFFPSTFCNLPLYKCRNTFFFNLHSGGWNQGPLDTVAT
jgi:hypothetical protein